MSTPQLPLTVDGDPYELLVLKEHGGVTEARWSFVPTSIFYRPLSEHACWPTRESLEANTPQLSFHGHYGYSLGQFSEFFVMPDWNFDIKFEPAFRFAMGSIMGSVGDPTPLAHLLFRATHTDAFEGEFEINHTIRLAGCSSGIAEAAVLSALIRLRERGLPFRPLPVGDLDWPPEHSQQDDDLSQTVTLNPGVTDIEPLRMYIAGVHEAEPEAAFLQFYRVLEYYSVVMHQDQVDALRRNRDLAPREFIVSVSRLIGRDERATLGRLVATIADAAVLSNAVELGLLQTDTTESLTASLYQFRNACVHAKYDQRTTLHAESPFSNSNIAKGWRSITQQLGLRALNAFGAPLR